MILTTGWPSVGRGALEGGAFVGRRGFVGCIGSKGGRCGFVGLGGCGVRTGEKVGI